jgi:nicotinic acid mononucleotide adenylyltransferase
MGTFRNYILRFLCAGLSFSPAFVHADVYFYPGSFDLFHVTHETEVRSLLARSPDARVWIFPVEKAYYHRRPSGAMRPSFSKFETRKALIENTFADQIERVRVRGDLRAVEKPIFESLLELVKRARSETGEEVRIYVGTDVVRQWRSIPGFGDFLEQVHLLVGKDPNDLGLFRELSETYENHPRVRFVDAVDRSVRSFEANRLLLGLRSFDDPEAARLTEFFSERQIRFLRTHWKDFARERSDFLERLSGYLETQTRELLLPRLLDSGVPAEVVDAIAKDESLLRWISRRSVGDLPEVASFASGLFDRLPHSVLRLPSTSYLVSVLIDAYLGSGELRDAWAEVSGSQRLLREGEKSLQGSRWKSVANYVTRHAYESLLPVAKKLGLKEERQLRFESNASLLPALPVDGSRELTVYRGVRRTKNTDRFLETWRNEGFLSKNALAARLRGESLESSLEASKRLLLPNQFRDAAINHVLGEWKETTSLVSSTFDKAIAIAAAGEDGLVFTLRVPRKSGLVLNDPIFWRGTPWEKTGNPFANAQEFAILHHVAPSEIVEIERVSGPVPHGRKYALEGYRKILTSIPRMALDYCQRLLRAVTR